VEARSSTETIADAMAATRLDPPTQHAQTRFRQGLAGAWTIPAGATVLEVGCGQGDTTAVLADAVGPAGHVVAVDIADPSYGSPITIGDSLAHLRSSPLGSRVEVHLRFDVLATSFPSNHFDYVVLANCGWYLPSLEHLHRLLSHVRPWASVLCLSEWDLTLTTPAQLPHLLAVLIQAQLEAYTPGNGNNIRTPFSRPTLDRVLTGAGYTVTASHVIDTAALRDADWEIHTAAAMATPALLGAMPTPVRDLVTSQLDLLGAVANPSANTPLPAYALTAT
jgi:SAM-dependent methyltransferase